MCFSATASFISGSVLLVVGSVTLSKVKTASQLPFALIPILFALQQFFEGIVWLSLTHSDFYEWNRFGTIAFLILAQVLWPVYVPFSIFKFEHKKSRKNIFLVLTLAGLALSVYLATCMVLYPVSSEIGNHHIHYELAFPNDRLTIIGIGYVILTVIPPFISSARKMLLIGSINLLSFVVTYFLYDEYVISLWCFFAALISVITFFIVKEDQAEVKVKKHRS